MTDVFFRIEACNPERNLDWFTVHGFQGAGKRQRVIATARSMREHMSDDFLVRVLEKSKDDAEVIWKE
jgi:hypothetical protein